ncbi:hypothetical protein [Cellulomonas timonensis]|uniref:hypothetical protein n=1 Tax=Cellulomonas timonensis TaxID=1689271 RepID=UPI000831A425|nr:hypothetical protein [Cellulomonas timonensis]
MTAARARLAAAPRMLARDVSALTVVLIGAVALTRVIVGGRVLLHACTSADGPLAMLGVRLALLQGSADCPDGSLAMDPAGAHRAVLVMSLAVPVLAAHAALGACGIGLTALLVRVVTAAGHLLRAVLHRLPRPSAPHVLTRALSAAAAGPVARLRSVRLASPPRRGPPLRLA